MTAALGFDFAPTLLIVVAGTKSLGPMRLSASLNGAAIIVHVVFAFRCESPMNTDLARMLAAVIANSIGFITSGRFADANDTTLTLWSEPAMTQDLSVMLLTEAFGIMARYAILYITAASLSPDSRKCQWG